MLSCSGNFSGFQRDSEFMGVLGGHQNGRRDLDGSSSRTFVLRSGSSEALLSRPIVSLPREFVRNPRGPQLLRPWLSLRVYRGLKARFGGLQERGRGNSSSMPIYYL